MSQTPSRPTTKETVRLRKCLLGVRFPIEARVGQGMMTVGQLLSLHAGSIVRSASHPGERIVLCSGKVRLASADPLVEDGELLLKVEETGAGEA